MTASASSTSQSARRYLAIWFPLLAADRILRQGPLDPDDARANLPLVVVEKIKGGMQIVALSRAAKKAGLIPGVSLADARSRIPDLWVEEIDHRADADLLHAVAEDCDHITPIIMIDAPDGLTLDITGSAHLFGGEAKLRLGLSQRLRRAGLHPRTVIASAPDTARALARFGRTAIVAPGDDITAVRALPIAALQLPEEQRIAIQRAGLKTIGALIDRPGELFAARFGKGMLRRLRRLQGILPSPLTPRRAVPMLWVERRFAEPIGRMEDIEAALSELTHEACTRLFEQREGGRVFEAGFHRADGAVRRIHVETGRPVRDPAVVRRLFREKLDSLADPIDPGFGFDLIRLALLETEAQATIQSGLDGRVLEADEVADLTDRLAARFGPERVLRFMHEDTHEPSRAARTIPASFNPMTSAVWPIPNADEPPLRPVRIFNPPQKVNVGMAEIPDGWPRRFTWRRKNYKVIRAEGPERIAPEWWRASATENCDYYRVEDTDGARFWLFRTGDYSNGAKWFVQGVFA